MKKIQKLSLVILVISHSLFSFSQEIKGSYCTNSTNKKNTQLHKTCFIFKTDFTFEEQSIHHNISILSGTFEIKKNLLILHYDDISLQNVSFNFKIIKNDNNTLIIKDLNRKEKYFLHKTTNI